MNATDGPDRPDRNGSDLTQGRFHGQGSQALVEGIEVLCHPGAKETTHQQTWLFVPPPLVMLGDSVSAGQYLPSNDDAHPRLLAADLHARLTVYAVPEHTTAQTHSMYTGEF